MEDTFSQFLFLFRCEVFSVNTVSRDTNDNIFTTHDFIVNIFKVHNVQVNVLTCKFSTINQSSWCEVSIKNLNQVIYLFITSFTKCTRRNLSS